MSDELKLSQVAAKGDRAASLLGNDLLSEAFKGLEDSYSAAWRATLIGDVSGREKLFLAINIVGKVQEHLQLIVNNGKLAAAELRQLAETAEAARRWENV
jgi:hypothetical protein